MDSWRSLKIPIIGITGGKGGTGKTTVAINLAYLFSINKKVLIVDFDVDAPNVAILLGAELEKVKTVKDFIPIFNDNCNFCGKCQEVCLQNCLLQAKENKPILFPELCNGCECCKIICPNNAINDGEKEFGYIYKGSIYKNLDLIVGELKLREPRSAKVVESTKDYAYEQIKNNKYDVVIIDTAPGAHCDIVVALEEVKTILSVTEPTLFGRHDLERILKLIEIVNKEAISKIVLNRADMTTEKQIIYELAEKYNSEVIADIPMDRAIMKSYSEGAPVCMKYPESKGAKAFKKLHEQLEAII
ncbi:MAG: nucleotide-binding protein [Candidatus Helarchaeota archaeon]